MIESIQIQDIASYTDEPELMTGLRKVNYVYGCNGSGKTTITRVIANAKAYENCAVNWKHGSPLQTLVYNRDFVEKNFITSSESNVKGIFTVGEDNIETLTKIEEKKKDKLRFAEKIDDKKSVLNGEKGKSGLQTNLTSLEIKFREKCWRQLKKYEKIFPFAFKGYRTKHTCPK